VLIHGQFLRADQIVAEDAYLRSKGIDLLGLDIFPSLFPMHTFYWGDWYSHIVGSARAEFISPAKAVQDKGMKFSIHSDAPVTGAPNSMRILDSAVNRTTRPRGGKSTVLGPDQRISPIVALKAMTIWPAYQYFEEKTKGSIEKGKNADFVVLSQNPLTVARENLICIQILQTIRGGEKIYENKGAIVSDEKFAADCAAKRNPSPH
jgi:predicted amidohydrolase YtcJ